MSEKQTHADPDDRHEEHTKTTTVIVNGRKKTVDSKSLTFDEVVALAFDPIPSGDNVVFTISWKSGKKQGRLLEGQSVDVKEGMIFNVGHSNKS